MRGLAAYTVVGESLGGHDLRIIQVPAINHDRVFQFLAYASEIKIGKLLPLGEDEQCVGSMSRFVGRIGIGNLVAENFASALDCRRIVGGNFAALLQQ